MRGRGRDDTGTVLVEVTWLAILLMLPLVYVVLAVFEVQRAAFGVSGAARAAARAYVVAPSEAEAPARATAAARLALEDQRLSSGEATLDLGCTPDPSNCLAPGSAVLVDVGFRVRLPLVPDALGGQTPSVRVSAHHRLPYGTFRADRP